MSAVRSLGGGWQFDFDRKLVFSGEQKIWLTITEAKMLLVLWGYDGHPIERGHFALLAGIVSRHRLVAGRPRTYTHLYRLRAKLWRTGVHPGKPLAPMVPNSRGEFVAAAEFVVLRGQTIYQPCEETRVLSPQTIARRTAARARMRVLNLHAEAKLAVAEGA